MITRDVEVIKTKSLNSSEVESKTVNAAGNTAGHLILAIVKDGLHSFVLGQNLCCKAGNPITLGNRG